MINPFETIMYDRALMIYSVQDRLDVVMRADARTLRAILQMPRSDVQVTVRRAAERRLRTLERSR